MVKPQIILNVGGMKYIKLTNTCQQNLLRVEVAELKVTRLLIICGSGEEAFLRIATDV